MSNLAVRLLTAAVGVPGLLLLLYFGPAWGFWCLILVATLIGTQELLAMTHAGHRGSQVAGLVIAAASSTVLYWWWWPFWPTVVVIVLMLGPLVTLLDLGDIKTAAFRALAMSVAPLFVTVPLLLLCIIRTSPNGAGWVVVTLMFAWLGDTGGYFGGRFFGKHKLHEEISPKKTVEGAFGGLAGSLAGGLLAHFWFLPELRLVDAVVLSVAAGIMGQFGDLGESLLKRSMGVKDSGAIVPGHGGLLDRVDALLMTSTVVFLYLDWRR